MSSISRGGNAAGAGVGGAAMSKQGSWGSGL